jgi:hypothetical protein
MRKRGRIAAIPSAEEQFAQSFHGVTAHGESALADRPDAFSVAIAPQDVRDKSACTAM